MCGEELPASAYASRFGALAIMSPTASPASSPESSPRMRPEEMHELSGSVAFFNDNDHNCDVATHIRFSPSGALPATMSPCLLLSIHDFGDVSIEALEQSAVHRLKEPLHLHVGDDAHGNRGIIGRKITMYRVASPADRSLATAVAEGIVGYNSLPRLESSL